MRSPSTLREWIHQLLPHQSPCSVTAAWELTRSLLLGFNTNLTQLGRQCDRDTEVRAARQHLSRWLKRSAWEPDPIYANLSRVTRRLLAKRKIVLLLVDTTFLGTEWLVLQVSIPWERRALPLYRHVQRWENSRRREGEPAQTQQEMVQAALEWLRQHLPGPAGRYVLAMDRGFPSHALIRELQARRWRFVVRLKGNWKMTHPDHTGLLRGIAGLSSEAVLYRDAVLGSREKGEKSRVRHSRANVVCVAAGGAKEPWFLATSETNARQATAFYCERMGIEQEFRDLKGPLGLDCLAAWLHADRIARFLAWVAVWEWRLAYLWWKHELRQQASKWHAAGPLSWIRITREWLERQIRCAAGKALACL
jgi:hypothetical protein